MTSRNSTRRSTLLLALAASASIILPYAQANDSRPIRLPATEGSPSPSELRPPIVTRFPTPASSQVASWAPVQAEDDVTIMRLPAVEAEDERADVAVISACVDDATHPDEAPTDPPSIPQGVVVKATLGGAGSEEEIPTFSIRPSMLAEAPRGAREKTARLSDESDRADNQDKEYVLNPTEVATDNRHETDRERLLRLLYETAAAEAEAEAIDPLSDPQVLAMIQGLRLPAKVAEQADGMVENAIRLARLGASHSARSEFTQALRLTAQALDAQIGRQVHSRALSAGLIALDEAEDFAHPMSRPEDDLMLEGFVAGHKTPILRKTDLSNMPPLVAMQKYYEYAYRQLSIGGGEEAPASKALFALAKLDDFCATEREVTYLHKTPRLIALYQAALTVFPQNSQAANELGVQLAATGQMQAAGEALRHGLRRAPTVTLWRNLAEVHRRRGEYELARKAENESRLAAQIAATPSTVTPRDLVQWVTPAEFARSAGPQHMAPVARSPSTSERTGTFTR